MDDEFIYFFALLKIIDYRIPWLAFEIVMYTFFLFFWQQPFWKQLYTNDLIDKKKHLDIVTWNFTNIILNHELL